MRRGPGYPKVHEPRNGCGTFAAPTLPLGKLDADLALCMRDLLQRLQDQMDYQQIDNAGLTRSLFGSGLPHPLAGSVCAIWMDGV